MSGIIRKWFAKFYFSFKVCFNVWTWIGLWWFIAVSGWCFYPLVWVTVNIGMKQICLVIFKRDAMEGKSDHTKITYSHSTPKIITLRFALNTFLWYINTNDFIRTDFSKVAFEFSVPFVSIPVKRSLDAVKTSVLVSVF